MFVLICLGCILAVANLNNSLVPGRCDSTSNFKRVIFKHMLRIKFMSTSCEIAHRWLPHNTFDDKSTLVRVMAWCHQAMSHYMSQCWPKSIFPDGITRPQWVNQWQLQLYIHVYISCYSQHNVPVLRCGFHYIMIQQSQWSIQNIYMYLYTNIFIQVSV